MMQIIGHSVSFFFLYCLITCDSQPMSLRVAIIGMGPVGQILAAFLKEADCIVAVSDNDEKKINRIRESGITLEGVFTKQVKMDHLFTSSRELASFKPHVVVLSVKIYHTPSVLAALREGGIADTLFICAQNGIGSEDAIVNEFGAENVLRMVLNFAGNLREPNVTTVTFFNGPNYLASVDDSCSEFSAAFAGLLSSPGLETMHVNSFWLLNRVWEKTILNAALSALCGITGLTMSEAMDKPALSAIVEQLIEESVAVARAEEIYFETNFNKKCLRYLRNSGDHHPSLAIDMQHNRPTEIDYFNGQFVKYGRKHYLKTPLHFAFTNLVKAHSEEKKPVHDPIRH